MLIQRALECVNPDTLNFLRKRNFRSQEHQDFDVPPLEWALSLSDFDKTRLLAMLVLQLQTTVDRKLGEETVKRRVANRDE